MLTYEQLSEELIINVLGREFFKSKNTPSSDKKAAVNDFEAAHLMLLMAVR